MTGVGTADLVAHAVSISVESVSLTSITSRESRGRFPLFSLNIEGN